jgi:hypothetical protein
MTTDAGTPTSAMPMVDGQAQTTAWEVALDRLQHPAPGQNHWLATVRPDGSPHLMPIIAFWIEGAFHFLVGTSTRKGRNLAADERCVLGTGNLTMPSMDLIVEGRARPVAEAFGGEGWPLEARGSDVYGPHGPTAGPRRMRSTGSSRRRSSGSRGCTGCSTTTGTTSRRAGRSGKTEARSCAPAGSKGAWNCAAQPQAE